MPYRDKEKKRESDRRYRRKHREKLLKWQREYNKRYYEDNRERILATRKLMAKTDSLFHEKLKEIGRQSYRKVANLWGVRRKYKPRQNDDLAIRAELFVAHNILPKHGFYDIILCRMFSKQFPFDILAKRNETRVVIEVTTSLHKTIDYAKKQLVDFMDAKLLICHIKPDFSQYFLFPVNMAEKRTTSCAGAFMEAQGVKFKEAS